MYRDEYREYNLWGNSLDPGKNYYIKLIGEKYPALGENNVDWVPTIMGMQLNEWLWWNGSWNYRQKYTSVNNQGYTLPRFRAYVVLNTSKEILDGTMNSNCSSIRAGNDTTEYQVYWENCNTYNTSVYVEIPWYVIGSNDFYLYWDEGGYPDVRNATLTKNVVLNLTMPESYFGGSTATIMTGSGLKLYSCQGYNTTGFDNGCFVVNLSASTVGTVNGTITTRNSESWGISGNNSLYQFGGDKSGGYSNEIHRFDSSGDTVTKMSATLATARRSASAARLDGEIWSIGGNAAGPVGYTNRYWMVNNTISQLNLRVIQSPMVWGFDDLDRIYVAGGYDGSVTNKIYLYYKNNTYSDTGKTINISNSGGSSGGYSDTTNHLYLMYIFYGWNGTGYIDYIAELNASNNVNTVTMLNASKGWATSTYRCDSHDKSIYCNSGSSTQISRFDMRVPSTKSGDLEIHDVYANESQGDNAIIEGIQEILGASIPIYSDQQIYIRYMNGSHFPGQFDEVVISGNQTWVFNYIAEGETPNNMNNLNLSTIVYAWEKENLTTDQIRDEVSGLINATKV